MRDREIVGRDTVLRHKAVDVWGCRASDDLAVGAVLFDNDEDVLKGRHRAGGGFFGKCRHSDQHSSENRDERRHRESSHRAPVPDLIRPMRRNPTNGNWLGLRFRICLPGTSARVR